MEEQTLSFRVCENRHEGHPLHHMAEGQGKPRSKSSFGSRQQHEAPKVLDCLELKQ